MTVYFTIDLILSILQKYIIRLFGLLGKKITYIRAVYFCPTNEIISVTVYFELNGRLPLNDETVYFLLGPYTFRLPYFKAIPFEIV